LKYQAGKTKLENNSNANFPNQYQTSPIHLVIFFTEWLFWVLLRQSYIKCDHISIQLNKKIKAVLY